MTEKSKSEKVEIAHPDHVRKSELRDLGGSKSDVWNAQLISMLCHALPQRSANYTKELRDNALKAMGIGLAEGKPADPIEAMLLGQIIIASNAANELHRLAWIKEQPFEIKSRFLSLADKSQRTMVTLIEGLNRHRGKGQQKVTVEHVHVHAGGQAIVGPVSHGGGGGAGETKEQPHGLEYAPSAAMLSPLEANRASLPIASHQG